MSTPVPGCVYFSVCEDHSAFATGNEQWEYGLRLSMSADSNPVRRVLLAPRLLIRSSPVLLDVYLISYKGAPTLVFNVT